MINPMYSEQSASAIAVSALGYLAGQETQFTRFLQLSGLEPAEIRPIAQTRAFQAAVLGFIRSDESLLLAFCANCGLDPAEIPKAHAALDPSQIDHG